VRREYCPAPEIFAELQNGLASRSTDIDWVTFVGSGEPTLHSQLGLLIQQVKSLTSIPVAVITNGSLLYRPEVREELSVADAVLPTLDAGSDLLYRAMNRPHPAFRFEQLAAGLTEFRQAYGGKLWIEVMLVRGLNDNEAALEELAAVLGRIEPDEVHISLPLRPPAEAWVEPAGPDAVARAAAILGAVAHILPPLAEVISRSSSDVRLDAVLGVISRHPMEEKELVRMLESLKPGKACEVLEALETSGRAQVVTRFGRRFWSAAGARYGCAAVNQRDDAAPSE
jgi:wyosine [tRNA(Phe)-imidazoG37] synthetase (radical SAM superfamily)